MADVSSVKSSIKAMKDFMNGKPNPEIPDSSAFGRTIVTVLEEVYFRLEALEREAGPGAAFISPLDGSNRLR